MNNIKKTPSSNIEEIVESKVVVSPTTEIKITVSKITNQENDLSDAAITSQIKEQFTKDPLLSKFHLNVFTHNGIVELSGSVNYQKCVDRGNEIANGVEGVKSVESEVFAKKDEEVSSKPKESMAAPVSSPRRRSSDDSAITAKIKKEVLVDDSVNSFQIKVVSDHGIVNVSGGVDTVKSIEHILAIIGEVKGVKSIENNLFARKPE